MFALADVNSFYASCETLFRPDLRNKPVVVLSNNDGCVIALSAGAKALGIKMGTPWFKIKDAALSQRVHAFSSNYALYASMSNRVMELLEAMAARAEQYSIDEIFLDVSGIDRCLSFETYGYQLREHVKQCTGLTIGVGMGPTKTLAKSAQWASKEWPQFHGVLALTVDNPLRTQTLLSRQAVEEVWGVGRKIGKKLSLMGITTALQLAQSNSALIRKHFSVVLERTVRELNGEACISLEEAPPTKQQIVCSRSFGRRITEYEFLRQAVCQHAERAAEKLRQEGQFCRHISASIKTSPFSPNETYYANHASEILGIPTQDTRDIVSAAVKSLDRIWLEGHRYAKAGVILNDFSPSGVAQLGLFDETPIAPKSEQLMAALDSINHGNRGKIWFAGQGISPQWQMKREMLSPAYTTQWNKIPKALIR